MEEIKKKIGVFKKFPSHQLLSQIILDIKNTYNVELVLGTNHVDKITGLLKDFTNSTESYPKKKNTNLKKNENFNITIDELRDSVNSELFEWFNKNGHIKNNTVIVNINREETKNRDLETIDNNSDSDSDTDTENEENEQENEQEKSETESFSGNFEGSDTDTDSSSDSGSDDDYDE